MIRVNSQGAIAVYFNATLPTIMSKDFINFEVSECLAEESASHLMYYQCFEVN